MVRKTDHDNLKLIMGEIKIWSDNLEFCLDNEDESTEEEKEFLTRVNNALTLALGKLKWIEKTTKFEE